MLHRGGRRHNSHDCERFVAATIERYGRLDILVNNVGVSNPCGSIRLPSPIGIASSTLI